MPEWLVSYDGELTAFIIDAEDEDEAEGIAWIMGKVFDTKVTEVTVELVDDDD